jgi:hypothetical protein
MQAAERPPPNRPFPFIITPGLRIDRLEAAVCISMDGSTSTLSTTVRLCTPPAPRKDPPSCQWEPAVGTLRATAAPRRAWGSPTYRGDALPWQARVRPRLCGGGVARVVALPALASCALPGRCAAVPRGEGHCLRQVQGTITSAGGRWGRRAPHDPPVVAPELQACMPMAQPAGAPQFHPCRSVHAWPRTKGRPTIGPGRGRAVLLCLWRSGRSVQPPAALRTRAGAGCSGLTRTTSACSRSCSRGTDRPTAASRTPSRAPTSPASPTCSCTGKCNRRHLHRKCRGRGVVGQGQRGRTTLKGTDARPAG